MKIKKTEVQYLLEQMAEQGKDELEISIERWSDDLDYVQISIIED